MTGRQNGKSQLTDHPFGVVCDVICGVVFDFIIDIVFEFDFDIVAD